MDTKNMAAEMNTVVEGCLKHRDGKKWKSRYCVIKKPSPVADRLLVSLYKEQKDVNPKSTLLVEDYYGIEADLNVDKENHALAIICQKNVIVFAFQNREEMLYFEINILESLGQDQQYSVRLCKVPNESKLPLGPVRLHIKGQKFCFTAQSPPKVLMSWNIPELRRFGPVDGKFMFEGGSRCGKGFGVHGFESNQQEEIYHSFLPTNTSKGEARRPHTWRKQRPQDCPINVTGMSLDVLNLPVSGDHNFRADDPQQAKPHYVGVVKYNEAMDIMEKTRLMSIENVDKERLTRIYDIPPQLVRKVDSLPNISDVNFDQLANVLEKAGGNLNKYEANKNDDARISSNKHLTEESRTKHKVLDGNKSNRNSGDWSRSNRNSGDGTRSNRNSGDGTRSKRNSGEGTRSNRNSGDGTRSNRNSGDGTRSNRNSGDGTRSNRNSGDGSRSNRNSADCSKSKRNSGDGRRVKRNSVDGSRSNRYSSDSSQSSRSSGEASKWRPRKGSGENSLQRFSEFAKRSSLALRKSLDNILAGNQSWIEDFDSECKENSLSKRDMYKSTSALCSLIPEAEFFSEEIRSNRSESVPHLTEKIPLCEGNHELEKLTQQEEILQREMILLDEMLQDCVEGNKENTTSQTGMSQGFVDALQTLTIDTQLLDCSNDKGECPDGEDKDPMLLSPNLTSKISRVPSCSKLAAPLPYFDLEKYDASTFSDHVYVTEMLRRGLSYDNLSSVSKNTTGLEGSFRTKSLSCSDSSGVRSVLSKDNVKEPEPPPLPPKLFNTEHKPPELPPKGPNLLRRQKGTSSLFNTNSENPPSRIKLTKPLPVSQKREVNRPYHVLRSGSPRQYKPTPIPPPTPPLPEREDSYILMKEISTMVASPERSSILKTLDDKLYEDDPQSCYMEMSAISNTQATVLPKSSNGLQVESLSKPQRVFRSQSARSSLSEYNRPKMVSSRSADQCDEDHENYFYMSPVLSESSININKEQNDTTDIDLKAAMPFPNLITFQSYKSSQDVDMSSSDSANNNNMQNMSVVNEKSLDVSSSSSKSGFFSRLRQRAKLKDRKLSLSSVEDLSRSRKSIVETSLSENISPVLPSPLPIESPSKGATLDTPPGSDRQRSSSVPNETFLRQTIQRQSLRSTEEKSSNSMNKRGSQSEDTLFTIEAKSDEDSSDPYFLMSNLQSVIKPDSPLVKDKLTDTGLVTDSPEETVPKETVPEVTPKQDSTGAKLKYCEKLPVSHDQTEPNPTEMAVSSGVPTSESSSTDDEKLLAQQIAKNNVSNNADDKAKDKAAAIVEHVNALAPFIPPKTKVSYPSGLSPVIEGIAISGKDHPLSVRTENAVSSEVPSSDKTKRILSKAALMKQFAKEHLRIFPPKEDENRNTVWKPQTPGKQEAASVFNGNGVSGDDGMNTTNPRLDVSSEVTEHLNSLSLSPHGSSTGSPGYRQDDWPLRSSPASTTLRPRSGKEYHRIDRRRLNDEHSQGSSPLSPKSPSAASIFTFDTPSSPSIRSFPSRDGESPASSPCPYMRGPYPYHSYVNLGKGSDARPNLYVNMDMTPPTSPYRRTHMPLEQLDPQLNYAEIDLSHAGSDRSKKSKKGSQKSSTIEYARIDMVATAAVSKTRKEQAQSREDNLKRSGRKYSEIEIKDRRMLGGSFRDRDRGRKLSTSSVDSNG